MSRAWFALALLFSAAVPAVAENEVGVTELLERGFIIQDVINGKMPTEAQADSVRELYLLRGNQLAVCFMFLYGDGGAEDTIFAPGRCFLAKQG